MLIIYGVLYVNFVYVLGFFFEFGVGSWLYSFYQSLEELVFYGYLCLFCCLIMLVNVSLVKVKYCREMEKVFFDIEVIVFLYVFFLLDGIFVRGGGFIYGSKGDENFILMFYLVV